jgi:glyoxylase-like metal-dependent hydrolase (beta-lactamase superfamily II)
MNAIDLGRFRLHLVSDGGFKLDGGAMFGVVPKTMWQKVLPADADNRIRFGTNCLLVEAGDELILIDSGLGDKQDEKFRGIYAYEAGARRLPESIRAAGFELADVTQVVLTHLHFDHCGWNTRFDSSGRAVPTFPNARYWLNRGEVEHARQPTERDRASYFPYNFEPLFEAGQVELFDDTCEVVPGVRAEKAPGHNADMCVVTLVDGGERAIFLADLVPTTAHVPLPWIMGYDLYPMQTLASKKLWLPRLALENWLCIFEHDYASPLGRIVSEKPGRFAAGPV